MGSLYITNSSLKKLLSTNKFSSLYNLRLLMSTHENTVTVHKTTEQSEGKAFELEDDEERINRLRDKSRLPLKVKKFMQDEMVEPHFEFHYKLRFLRQKYGKYGSKTGLNPGLCFPVPEELKYKAEYERLTEKPLDVMLEELKCKKAEKEEKRKARELEVEKNMQNLLKWRKEMLQKQRKREDDARIAAEKRQEVIAEIREELGFNVQEKDPRLRDALEKREAENKKRAKENREERKKIMLAKKLESLSKSPKTDSKEIEDD